MLSESLCGLVAVPECGAQCALTILMPGPDGPIPPAAAQEEMGLYFGGSYIEIGAVKEPSRSFNSVRKRPLIGPSPC